MDKRFALASVVVILALFTVGRATSPLPAPPHRFIVSGTLVRSGSSLAGYAVVLLGRLPGDSVLHVLQGVSSTDQDLTVPGVNGEYWLTVTVDRKPDSLAVAAFHPVDPAGRSLAFTVPESSGIAMWKTYRDEIGSGCGDCGTQYAEHERISHFEYTFSSVPVSIP